jgi:cobalt-zinc-cadmium efflux system protein
MVHLLTGAAVSAAVLVSALLVGLTGWAGIDALTAIGVGLAVALDAVGETLRSLPGVVDDMDVLHEAKLRPARLGIARSTLQLEPPGASSPQMDSSSSSRSC